MIDFDVISGEVATALFSIEEKYRTRGRIAERDALAIIVRDVISQLDTDDGKLKNTAENIRKADKLLKKAFLGFDVISEKSALQMYDALAEIFEQAVLPNFGRLVRQKIDSLDGIEQLYELLGITKDKKVIEGSKVDSAVSVEKLKKKARAGLVASIQSEANKAATTAILSTAIQGAIISNFTEFFDDGAREFREEAAANVAKKYDLEYLIYTGGIIKTSRKFCVDRNRKVFHVSDLDKWKNDPNLVVPKGGYNPITQRGGYNCRHFLMWITKEEAEQRGYNTKKE